MSASKGTLLDKGWAALEDPSELLEAYDIKQSEIDDMISEYKRECKSEKILEAQIASWKTSVNGGYDPQGKLRKLLAKGIAALSKMQKSSDWKVQVGSFSQKPKCTLHLSLHCKLESFKAFFDDSLICQ